MYVKQTEGLTAQALEKPKPGQKKAKGASFSDTVQGILSDAVELTNPNDERSEQKRQFGPKKQDGSTDEVQSAEEVAADADAKPSLNITA